MSATRELAGPEAARARVTDLGEDRFTMGYRVVSVAEEVAAAEGTG